MKSRRDLREGDFQLAKVGSWGGKDSSRFGQALGGSLLNAEIHSRAICMSWGVERDESGGGDGGVLDDDEEERIRTIARPGSSIGIRMILSILMRYQVSGNRETKRANPFRDL